MLINCVAYQNGRKLADIQVERDSSLYSTSPTALFGSLSRILSRRSLKPCRKSLACTNWRLKMPATAINGPRSKSTANRLFVVLQMIEPTNGDLNVGEVAIFVGKNYVLSVRSRAKRGFTDVRERCEREPELLRHGPGYVLYALMDAVVDRYFPILDSLETQLEGVEERIFANQPTRANVEDLYDLKKKLMILKHAAEPLLEATSKLFRWPCASRLCRPARTISVTSTIICSALTNPSIACATCYRRRYTVNLSLITLQESEVTKRLAAYAALVAVPTMIVGVYGMNFDYMPELRSPYGYLLTLAVMAAYRCLSLLSFS